MTGFKLQTSGIESDCSANWATTTSQQAPFKKMWNLNQEAV